MLSFKRLNVHKTEHTIPILCAHSLCSLSKARFRKVDHLETASRKQSDKNTECL